MQPMISAGSHDVDRRNEKLSRRPARSMLVAMAEPEELAQIELLRGGFVVLFLAFVMEGIPEHLSADEGEQGEGDPMVDRRDVDRERASHNPADDRA